MRQWIKARWAAFKATYAWRHRTKNIGAVGLCAAGVQNYLGSHHIWMLSETQQGAVLAVISGVVVAIGGYNSLAAYYGWNDAP